jgi:succinyl-CoA synthetase beta subunit
MAPWTSSSSTAASRRTSSTSAAASPKEAVTEAFRIILSDDKVKGVLVNIFGGIAKCDTDRRRRLIKAAKEVGFKVPVVVRLEGTNVERPARCSSTPAD